MVFFPPSFFHNNTPILAPFISSLLINVTWEFKKKYKQLINIKDNISTSYSWPVVSKLTYQKTDLNQAYQLNKN